MFVAYGILLLIFYTAHFHYHYSWNRPADSLWLCNVSNVVLAAGLFLKNRTMMRIAAVWLVPGIPLWLWDMKRTSDTHYTTFLTHIGGTLIALLVLKKIGYRKEAWKYAALYAAIVFIVSRFFTPPGLNVNLAHSIYPGWEIVFSSYWQYLLLITFQVMAGLILISILFEKIFPPPALE